MTMYYSLLKSKIHKARITDLNVNYEGSITIDKELIDQSGLLPYEKVLVADLNNGERFETYVIAGKKKSGVVCINGAAAHLCKLNDRIIIMSFAQIENTKAKKFKPVILKVDENNRKIS